MATKNVDDFLLTATITVGQTRDWIIKKDNCAKTNLIDFIHHRFNNRYIKHLKNTDSGFLKMAVSCLMIETLESFKQGKKDTKGIGQKMFIDFFRTEGDNFPNFDDISKDFYSSIRCGILHQAETTNAWRILRKNDLLDRTNKTINATKFVLALEGALSNYVASLKSNDFNSTVWKNAILKIEDICENCKSSH